MGMTWSVDLNDDIPRRARAGAEHGLDMALELILATARQRVPIEEGTLERSGATTRQGLSGTVSFDTPYAVRQHEDMSLRHDTGRSAKYLETAMTAERDEALRVVRAQINRAIGG